MPEAAEIPVVTQPTSVTSPADMAHAMDTFDKHFPPEVQEYLPGEEPPGHTPPVKESPAEVKPVETTKEKTVDELLAEDYLNASKPPEENKEQDEFDKLVNEKPTGQLKHDRYEALQAATKRKVDALEAKLKEYEEKVSKIPEDGVPEPAKKEIQTLKEKLDKYESELERHAYRKSRKFQEKFGADEAALKSQLSKTAKEFGVADDDMARLSASSGKLRATLLSELDVEQDAKDELRSLLRSQDILNEKMEADVSRSREELAAEAREYETLRQKQEREQAEEDNRIFDDALKNAESKLVGFKPTDNPAREAERQSMIKLARSLFSGSETTQRVAEILMRGVHAEADARIIKNMSAKIESQAALLAKLQGVSPSGGNAPNGSVDESKLSSEERAMRTFDKYAQHFAV